MMLLNYLIQILMILISVAFFTLLERKILGYSHFRLGPNKVGMMGIFQPFSDALKLFSKEYLKINKINFYIYFISPLLGIFIMMTFWILIPFWGENLSSNISILFYFCMASMSIYFLIGTGWSSSSKYSIMGSYRSVAQAISYEVNIFLLIFSLNWLIKSFSFQLMKENNMKIIMMMPLMVLWLTICLAESNRTPFDFSEGESELVSGFNTEYKGGLFSLIFITEYGSILFFSMFTIILFMNFNLFFSFKLMLISFFYVWIRSTLPRLRYDKLMLMSWKGILPLIMSMMFIFFIMF